MYVIAFDVLISNLKTYYGEQQHSAYSEIKKIMDENDFYWIQGNTNIIEKGLIAAPLAMNALNKIDWFKNSFRDIRPFRLEDWSDFTLMFKKVKNIIPFIKG